MQTEERRAAVLAAIKSEKSAISASALASRFSVSRQIIVGDIAILRAEGADITATPRGYVMGGNEQGVILRRIACQHDRSGMEEELNTIVDMGCTVVDVIVEHPIYGEIAGMLQLSNRYSVQSFIKRCEAAAAIPLSLLTDGIHLHTIACPDEEAYERVVKELKEKGILL